jgi:hypothetical protein
MSKKKVLGLVIFALLLATLAGLWISRKGSGSDEIDANEKAVREALLKLARIEGEFRAKDLDGNRVLDFWTGDVASLYALDVGAGPLKLIEKELALADAAPLRPPAEKPAPYHGYYVIAVERDESDCLGTSEDYKRATDGTMGKVHNTSRFAFCAYPASYGKSGRQTFVLTENSTTWKIDTAGKPMLRIPCQQPPPHEHGKRAPYDDSQ